MARQVHPPNHIVDSQKLIADAVIELFQIDLYEGSSLYLKADHSETWNGNLWEGIAIKLTGEGNYSDDQSAQSKLQVQNPDGNYSPLVSQRQFNNGMITRYRVLLDDLRQNNPIYVSHVWQISHVEMLNRAAVTFALRNLSDAPNFVIPADTYQPPDYPAVTL